MIRMKLFKLKMIVFLVLFLLALLSCKTSKKAKESTKAKTEASSKETISTEVKTDVQQAEQSKLTIKEETNHFGDSLKGSQPIDSNGIEVESAGIKFNASLKPVKDKDGNTTGYKLNYNINAKPTSKTNKQTELNSTAQRAEETNLKTQYAGEKKAAAQTVTNREESESRKGFTLPGWVYALVILIAIVALAVFFRPIITFFKSWKK